MKVKKIVLTVLMSLTLIIGGTYKASAGPVEAGADVALLIQQIAQFVQDGDFDIKKWNDVERTIRESQHMWDTASSAVENATNSSLGFFSIGNKLFKLSRDLIDHTREYRDMVEWLMETGDLSDVRKLSRNYNKLLRYYRYCEQDYKTLQQFFKKKGNSSDGQGDAATVLAQQSSVEMVDEVKEEAEEEFKDLKTAIVVKRAKMKSKKANANFLNTIYY